MTFTIIKKKVCILSCLVDTRRRTFEVWPDVLIDSHCLHLLSLQVTDVNLEEDASWGRLAWIKCDFDLSTNAHGLYIFIHVDFDRSELF